MTLTLPKWARALIYVVTLLGAPVATYLRAKEIIGDLELALWSAEVAAASTLALLNLPGTAAIVARVTSRDTGETADVEGVVSSDATPVDESGRSDTTLLFYATSVPVALGLLALIVAAFLT